MSKIEARKVAVQYKKNWKRNIIPFRHCIYLAHLLMGELTNGATLTLRLCLRKLLKIMMKEDSPSGDIVVELTCVLSHMDFLQKIGKTARIQWSTRSR